MGDRRFDLRKGIAAELEVQWADASGAAQKVRGAVADVSSSGARIRVPVAAPGLVPVVLLVDGHEVRAAIRYCQRRGSEFILGLNFETGSEGMLRAALQRRAPAQSPAR